MLPQGSIFVFMIHIFIINPFAGEKTFADDLRTKLESVKNLDYFVFNTRYEGYETELVKKVLKIFEDEKLRFYCCGGSGTMRNMLNGFDDLSKAEVAFFPCGLTNDFLKMFGKDEERFHQIEELINGDVIEVDYIKTNHGVSLNTLSTGLDSNCLNKMDDYRMLRFLKRELPYTMATVYSAFVSRPYEYEIIIDGKDHSGKMAEIFIGNGRVFGGNLFLDKDTCINDGKAMTRIIGNKWGFGILSVLTVLTGKKYDQIPQKVDCGECRTVRIRRTDGEKFNINQDGNLIRDVEYCEAEIVHKGLHLVVPKGVSI